MNPTDSPAPLTSPLPWMVAHLQYARVLDWGDPGVRDLDIFLAGPDGDSGARGEAVFWLAQGGDIISIPFDAMEQFVAGIIQAGVELGQR